MYTSNAMRQREVRANLIRMAFGMAFGMAYVDDALSFIFDILLKIFGYLISSQH